MRSSSSTVRMRVPTGGSLAQPRERRPHRPSQARVERAGPRARPNRPGARRARSPPATAGPPSRSADPGARLGRDQRAGGEVPGRQPELVVRVDPTERDRAQVDRRPRPSVGCRGRGAARATNTSAWRPSPLRRRSRTRWRPATGRAAGDRRGGAARRCRSRRAPTAATNVSPWVGDRTTDARRRRCRRPPRRRSTPPSPGGRRRSWSCRRSGRRPSATSASSPPASLPAPPRRGSASSGRAVPRCARRISASTARSAVGHEVGVGSTWCRPSSRRLRGRRRAGGLACGGDGQRGQGIGSAERPRRGRRWG